MAITMRNWVKYKDTYASPGLFSNSVIKDPGSFSIFTILSRKHLILLCMNKRWLPQHQSSHPHSRLLEGGGDVSTGLVPFVRNVKPSQTLLFRNFPRYISPTRTESRVHPELQGEWESSYLVCFHSLYSGS